MESGLPETLDEFVEAAQQKETLQCETCGDDVKRRYLKDGECVGCRNGPGGHAAPRTDGGVDESGEGSPLWKHLGNPACHDEEFKCTGCGRIRSISNRSDRYQEAGEPEPCDCHETTGDRQ